MGALIVVVIVTISILIISLLVNTGHKHKRIAIPFKESMDLINVPVVTFINNNIKLHFLLDTGSDSSFIKEDVLDSLNIKSRSNDGAPIITGGGEVLSAGIVSFDISYKNQTFENDFEVANMTQIWEDLTEEVGVTIHGILGSKFFEKYKYQIDFEDLSAYSKK